MTSNATTWVRLSAAAYDVDLSVRQLQEYAKRPGCPRKSDGKGGYVYEWPAFNRFVRDEAKRDAARGDAPDDLDEARLRKLAAEAEIAEMERDNMRGLYVTVVAVEERWLSILVNVNNKLTQLEHRLADRLVPFGVSRKELRPIIREVVDEARAELRAESSERANLPEDDNERG